MANEIEQSRPMLWVKHGLGIPIDEIELSAMRSQGPGGQNVNKVNSAVHLRFDIKGSSLPDWAKARLLQVNDSRISSRGVLVIKAQNQRNQSRNKAEAYRRLRAFVTDAIHIPKTRRATRPSRAAKEKRLKRKSRRSETKRLRGRITDFD